MKARPAARKRPKTESDDENDDVSSVGGGSVLSTTPPQTKKQKKAPAPKKVGSKPLREIENEAISEAIDASLMLDGSPDAKPKKGSKSTEQYQKVRSKAALMSHPLTSSVVDTA